MSIFLLYLSKRYDIFTADEQNYKYTESGEQNYDTAGN